MLVHCNFFYQKIVSVRNKNESVKSLSRGRAKYFQCDLKLWGTNCKDSRKNGELTITRLEPGINITKLNNPFTFSSNTTKSVEHIRKVNFYIMYSWKCSDFAEFNYCFIKLIYHFKTPNYPLTEYQIYAVINNRLMRLSSKQWANGDMGQSSNRLNNKWRQLNFIRVWERWEETVVVRPIKNHWHFCTLWFQLGVRSQLKWYRS